MELKEMFMEFISEFGMLGIVFVIISLGACMLFVAIFAKLLSYGRKNRRAPKLTVYATVLDKHLHYSRSINLMDSTECFVTFEVESGDRLVLDLTEHEFGLLVEGDCGMLTFKGNRFCDFKRKKK